MDGAPEPLVQTRAESGGYEHLAPPGRRAPIGDDRPISTRVPAVGRPVDLPATGVGDQRAGRAREVLAHGAGELVLGPGGAHVRQRVHGAIELDSRQARVHDEIGYTGSAHVVGIRVVGAVRGRERSE